MVAFTTSEGVFTWGPLPGTTSPKTALAGKEAGGLKSSTLAWSHMLPRQLAASEGEGLVRLWTDPNPEASPRHLALLPNYSVSALAFLPNGSGSLLVAGNDGIVRSCDVSSPKDYQVDSKDTGALPKFAISSDGSRIAAVTDKAITLYESTKLTELNSLQKPTEKITAIASSQNGKKVAYVTVGNDASQKIIVWDTDAGNTTLADPPPQKPVQYLAIHSGDDTTGNLVAVGCNFSDNGQAKALVEFRQLGGDGQTPKRRDLGLATITTLNLGAQRDFLFVVTDPDGTQVRGLSLKDGGTDMTFSQGQSPPKVKSLALSTKGGSDGKPLVVAGTDGKKVIIWSLGQPGSPLASLPTDVTAPIASINLDGTRLAVADDKAIRLWQLDSGKPPGLELQQLPKEQYKQEIQGIALPLMADFPRSSVTFLGQNAIFRWKPDIIQAWGTQREHVKRVVLDPAGNVAVTVLDNSPNVEVLPLPAGKAFNLIHPDGTQVNAVLVLEDRIVTGSGEKDQRIRYWSREQSSTAPLLEVDAKKPVLGLAAGPKKTVIASLGKGRMQSYDLQGKLAGAPLGKATSKPVDFLASPAYDKDAFYFVAGSKDDGLAVWKWFEKAQVNFDHDHGGHDGPVYAVAYHPAGTEVLTGGADGLVRVWTDKDRWQSSTQYKLDTKVVYAIAYHPLLTDNSSPFKFATAGADGKLRLWNKDPTVPPTFGEDSHKGPIYSLAVRPKKPVLLATGSADLKVRLWTENGKTFAKQPLSHQDAVAAVAFSPDGNRLATLDFGHRITFWQIPEQPGEITKIGGPLTLDSPSAYSLVWVGNRILVPKGGKLVSASAPH
jgi:WD40 repeat protein